MKRKTSTTPTKIWSFGALAPTENQERFLEQLFLGNRYYNTLIEIERRRREKYRAARSEAVPTLAGLDAEWAKLDAELEAGIAALPKVAGKRKLTTELQAIKERRKEVSARMKIERAIFTADAHAKVAIARVDDAAQLEVKAARAATDLYWGSYLLIEKQIEQARKSKADPRFRRFEGNGRIGVQLQGGLSLAELRGGEDTRLRLVDRTSPAKVKNPKALHEVRIRVGSEGRAPIWATLPVVLHREIPDDAKIQWAWIKVSKIGGERRYSLQLVMESESFQQKLVAGDGVVAINFGWRARADGGRRVAYAVDDSGHEEEFALPPQIERSLNLVDPKSRRDLHFEDAKRALGAWMAIHQVPEWLKEETQHLWHWRSPGKLVKISRRLTEELLTGDDFVDRWYSERAVPVRRSGGSLSARRRNPVRAETKRDLLAPAAEVFAWLGRSDLRALAVYLDLWRRKNRHLWRWNNQQARAIAYRNDLFRTWSRRLSQKYAEILIEDFDLRSMAETPEPMEEQRHTGFRSTRAAAAPGELRSRIAEAAGTKLIKGTETAAKIQGHTITCFHCAHVNERSLQHRVTCVGCAREYDQDANNCRNQLRERLAGAPSTGGARNSPKPGEKTGESGSGASAGSATVDVVAAE